MGADGSGNGEVGSTRVPRPLRRAVAALARLVHSLHAAGGILLLVGLAVSVLALWALAELTDEVLAGETIRMDDAALQWLARHTSDRLDMRAVEVTSLGAGVTVLTITVVVAALLALLRHRHYAALLLVSVGGGWILSPLLKALFDRERPQVVDWRVPYAGQASFPSGHALMGMILYVTLAYIVHRLGGRWWVTTLAVAAATVVVTLIGVTRIYLGVHYPSDVLAGFAVGFVWAMLCAAVVEILRDRRATPPEKAPATR